MRRYCVLYDSGATEGKYRVISLDDHLGEDLWYVETDIPPITEEGMARKVVAGLNFVEECDEGR